MARRVVAFHSRTSCASFGWSSASASADALACTSGARFAPRHERANDTRPPLKWAGGKRWQLPHLQPLWTAGDATRLVEPFCGGLAVALGLRPAKALLHDVNPHLVNFYAWVKRGLVIDLPMENDSAVYYRHRTAFNEALATGRGDTAEAAGLFYYLNRTPTAEEEEEELAPSGKVCTGDHPHS